MRIESYNFLGNNYTLSQKKQYKNSKYSTGVFQKSGLPFISYQDFNISFGERLNRTPEDFYAQKFNLDNMPDTVRKYLFEDFEERHHMPPAQLQREAFQYLKLADTVRDIKDMYPEEPLFANLKELKDTKPNKGILLLLKWDAQTSQTPVFKDSEHKDLTTYLLKKVYLEGKTIDELNKDFDKDSTDAIKRELGVKDKQYFSHTNIYTLGIRYPKLPYYNSFLATRNDKEYIPPVRKSNVIVTEETKEKLATAMTKWWAGLNEMERAEQIQKMLHGKEMSDSIFSKYQGQIMTIAAAQMGFSEKLSDIFAEKYSDENFVQEFPEFAEQQREIMLEFWNKDPEFRTNYSRALQDTISEFETAYYSEDKTLLESLLNKALDLKAKVLDKAREKQYQRREMQKLAPSPKDISDSKIASNTPAKQLNAAQTIDLNSPNTVNKLYRKIQMESMKFYTDMFKSAFMDYLMKNTTQLERKVSVALSLPDAQKLLNVDDKEFEEIKKLNTDKYANLTEYFYLQHPLTAETNEFVVNTLLYDLTGNPEVFKYNRWEPIEFIKENKLEQEVLKQHNQLNTEMKKFARVSTGKELDDFANLEFDTSVILHVNQGFKYYPQYSSDMKNAGRMYDLYHQDPENYKAFLKNYNAAIKYYNNSKTSPHAKEVIIEHMVADYIDWLPNSKENIMLDYMLGNYSHRKQDALDKNYDIDLTSLYSLQQGAKQYFHKTETRYWVPEVEEKFLNFMPRQDYFKNTEGLAMFIAVNVEKYNKPIKNLSARDRKIAVDMSNVLKKMLHNDFEKFEPKLANANHAAINYVLYNLTKQPEALANSPIETVDFIKNKHLGKRIENSSELIQKKFEEYQKEISADEIKEFYNTTFYPMLKDIEEYGVEFAEIENQDNFEQAQKIIIDALEDNDSEITEKLMKYISLKTPFIRLLHENNIPEDDKDFLVEAIVVDCERKIARDIDDSLKF